MDTAVENITLSGKRNQRENTEETKEIKEKKKAEGSGNPETMGSDIHMLVSGMIKKNGKSFARVSFIRDKNWAEGIVPDGVIEKSEGFNEEELAQLAEYLVKEKDMILEQSKAVNPLKKMFGM